MSKDKLNLKLGNYYRWSYKELPNSSYEQSYWCKSRIATVKESSAGLYLADTFWSISGSDYVLTAALDNIELEFLGNINDYERISENYVKYYDQSDILNLNHPNNTKGNIYVRKGANKSKSHLLDELDKAVSNKEQELDYVARQLDSLLDTRAELVRGELNVDEVYF